jgi:parvulin-like peptidyl-prolyl isomerase
MTFRAKPVVKRAHRPAWEARDRRNFYLNLGFGLIVLLAVVILAVAAGLSYYNDHLASVGSVDGESISKDELRDRMTVEDWRLKESESRIATAVLAGHLTEAQATTARQTIEQQRQQLDVIALERVIDTKLQAKLAAQEGVSATPEDIDARLLVEATIPESRHAWVIEVEPATDLGAVAPTAAQKADAKAKADAALKDIQGGKSWEDVAKTVSTDSATAPQAGDLGWLTADDNQTEEALLKGFFAAPVNTPTAVIEGSDGVYRIGRVTEIVATAVDDAYQAKIQNDEIDLERYRAVVAGDVIHEKLQAKIVADVTAPGPQRKVSEIYVGVPAPDLGADAIKVRHILYSPNGDPSKASSVGADDPAWAVAREKATAAHVRLQANPSLFDSIARAESDEGQANGPTGSGGKLPFFDSKSSVDEAFLKAIMVPGLKAGDLLQPVKSAFGWHVIQVMYRPTDVDHLTALKARADAGEDFALLARDTSVAQSAGTGGDLGWIARGQLDDKLTTAIFATPIGKTSEIVTVEDDGLYLYKVFAEEVRTPEGRQLEELKGSAFSKWYEAKKSAAVITRNTTADDTVTGS